MGDVTFATQEDVESTCGDGSATLENAEFILGDAESSDGRHKSRLWRSRIR